MPRQPDFVPINIPEVSGLALDFDTSGYVRSDEDFKKRFPNLQAGRDFTINDALGELQGGMSPTVTNALAGAGLGENFGDTSFKQSKNMGKKGMEILSREKRGRDYFQNLLAKNPQRQFGLSGQDVAHLALASTGSQNVWNQGVFGSNVANYNAAQQAAAANNASYASAATSLAGLVGQFARPTTGGYLDSSSYGYNPSAYSSNGVYYPQTNVTIGGGY